MQLRLIVPWIVALPVALFPPTAARPADSAPRVAMIEVEGEGAGYWSRWRGPSGQGRAKGDYPDTWSLGAETPDDHVLWRVRVPGRGNSSPIVWGDRIFLTTAYDGGSRRSVLCFERFEGRLLWETFAPAAVPEQAHRKNGHASSTPTTDGERVFAYLGNHGLLAVDLAGRIVWHRDLGRFQAYHGTASSPLIYRDRLIVVQDHQASSGSFVAAFDARTGRELWRRLRPARVGWNSPIAIRSGDHDEIVVSGQERVIAYHPDTGEELWRTSGNTLEAIPTPVVGEGLVFVSSGRAGPTLAIRPGGRGDVTLSHVVWTSAKGSPFVPSAILAGGELCMVNDMSAVVTCLAADSGEVRWQGRLGEPRREGFSASPVAVGDKLFFTDDDGRTFVVHSGAEPRILHVNELGERVLASPALAGGRWYFRTERHLVALGRPDLPRTP